MPDVFKLKISIPGSQPLIWRRLLIPGDVFFDGLHNYVQISFGWGNSHLYQFNFRNYEISREEYFEAVEERSPQKTLNIDIFTQLKDLDIKKGETFTYIYDFGDWWEHLIEVEEILKSEENLPRMIGGEMAAPPENAGGLHGYENLLNILKSKDHPEYLETKTWVGEKFDPAHFDLIQTNEKMLDFYFGWEDKFNPPGEFDEIFTEKLKELTRPEDLLNEEKFYRAIKEVLLKRINIEGSIESNTYLKLKSAGLTEGEIFSLMIKALEIEWYYDLKYETFEIFPRYAFNLKNLPSTPVDIPNLDIAFNILEECRLGIPFEAIEYIRKDKSPRAKNILLNLMRQYFNAYEAQKNHLPLWLAIVAEEFVCEELLKIVANFIPFENYQVWDDLNEELDYLYGKISEKFPDAAVKEVFKKMDETKPGDGNEVIFLFSAFYFCNKEKYRKEILKRLYNIDAPWFDYYVGLVGSLMLPETLPVFIEVKEKLEKQAGKKGGKQDNLYNSSLVEINAAIENIKKEGSSFPEFFLPFHITRKNWKEHFKEREDDYFLGWPDDFEEEPDENTFLKPGGNPIFNFPHLPVTKEKLPGRNDPCYCGSDKKYKNCCWGKDRLN